MREEWKDVLNYEGLYQVSNLGRVKSLPRNGTGKEERVLKLKLDKYGYSCVGLRNKNKKYFSIHRLVAIAFVKNKDNGINTQVDHIDGDKRNNSFSNLRWCTCQENINWKWDKRKTITNSRGITIQSNGTFQARKTANGFRHNVGTFKTLKEAENAYNEF
tara:strand:- start:46 stop:525 length:480 start_codon:yes stop_codon:yes gene_type:complete